MIKIPMKQSVFYDMSCKGRVGVSQIVRTFQLHWYLSQVWFHPTGRFWGVQGRTLDIGDVMVEGKGRFYVKG